MMWWKFKIDWSDDPEAIANRYGSSYARRKAECERRVSQWRWASNVMYDPRPCGVIMEGGPGRWMTQKSTDTMPYEYGLSARGEFVVERIYMGHHYREEFFYANDQRVVSFSYTYDFKELAWVRVTRVAEGRVVSHSRYAPQDQIGRLEQRFDYAQGVLRRSTVREVRCGQTWDYEYHFGYDEEGVLIRVETRNQGGGKVLYEKHGEPQ